MLGQVGPQATWPASAEPAYLVVGGCGGPGGPACCYSRGAVPCRGAWQSHIERALEPWRGRSVHSVGTDC